MFSQFVALISLFIAGCVLQYLNLTYTWGMELKSVSYFIWFMIMQMIVMSAIQFVGKEILNTK
jgi:hypothetical protein